MCHDPDGYIIGAKSSPRVLVYAAESVHEQLLGATREYLIAHCRVNHIRCRISLPKLISWYSRDFLDAPAFVRELSPALQSSNNIIMNSNGNGSSAPSSPSGSTRRLLRQLSPSPSVVTPTQSASSTATVTPGSVSSSNGVLTTSSAHSSSSSNDNKSSNPLTISVGNHVMPALSPPPSPSPFAFANASHNTNIGIQPANILDWLLQYLPHAATADIRHLTMEAGILSYLYRLVISL